MMAEPFSASWFGLGVFIGFLGAALCAYAWFKVQLSRGIYKRWDDHSWGSGIAQPGTYTAPVPAYQAYNTQQHATHPAKEMGGTPGRMIAPDTAPHHDTSKVAMMQAPQPAVMASQAATTPSQVAITIAMPAQGASASNVPSHKRGASNTSMYDDEDLDEDWQPLLETVDAMLAKKGRPTMQANEKTVAIRKLAAATGTRGVDAALTAAVEEVLKLRAWNPAAAATAGAR